MKILQRYFAVSIFQAVLFVLLAFLALQAFIDLTGELPKVGRNGYTIQYAFLYVLVLVPGHVYEVMPIAALIGTIYTMAQFAASSEFTIMRASSMSTAMAAGFLFRIGIVFVVITFIFGEVITPRTEPLAERLKLTSRGAAVSSEFRSGLWTKDMVKSDGLTGTVTGSRFFNVGEARADGQLKNVKLYEFDTDMRLRTLTVAKGATYQGNNIWRLTDVTETSFSNSAATSPGFEPKLANYYGQETSLVRTVQSASKDMTSEVTPKILTVSASDPERMSASELAVYTRHLAENKQETERFRIAFWKKLIDPLAIFVLMALALPFAYMHTRSGGISLKIFIGIMIGVSFMLVNTLFSHLGLLSTWPAFLTAVAPSALYLLLALGALWWVERH
ncbi:lipopolysaccharide export system permease protein LptG [Janthinobacterium sp. HH103]|uniref:LPS export ABC transporter permease LptG n=1 Tax=Janthinobacterium agaricidamnosum TaxID=55508 RepID=A0A3G2E4Y2_9BURK|nr:MULTISPECIES: LPS export ABC transporter permease LptG [Janthinobacterium]AYM75353.1 LPS export ABC transporter permease LptG [Janthinobacterium agaricidamnosum]MCC7681239.1 LPS export ABC transporter permease LptG [Janthinobacterium sp. FW305-128]OEZ65609.1 lipopolysaccharide export system permease protein LptG [Janthinobacterium sp. HH100]OEZ82477.1 lipopolysaccharide export system permease protein LptG [Janthinobacterium sp. HH103]OEZ87845.1 lipopolysaccharide export system permease prot